MGNRVIKEEGDIGLEWVDEEMETLGEERRRKEKENIG